MVKNQDHLVPDQTNNKEDLVDLVSLYQQLMMEILMKLLWEPKMPFLLNFMLLGIINKTKFNYYPSWRSF